jgi:release factor glutamine methyltransferase
MNIGEWLGTAEARLLKAGVPTARLDTLVMLEDSQGWDRALLLAHPDTELAAPLMKKLDSQVTRRAEHVPLAYIRGKTEFYGREFVVNEHVLEPRPESETMIELLKVLAVSERLRDIVDMGSGSGALGVTAALELRLERVTLIDIDPKTFEVARANARRHEVLARYLESDIFTEHSGAYDAVLANLPYVPDNFQINTAASHEPRLAIFGGPDGLDVYRKLFAQAAALPVPPRYILTEALPPQHETLALLAARHGYLMEKEDDFIQAFRFDTAYGTIPI